MNNDQLAFIAEGGTYSRLRSGQIRVVLYADAIYAQQIVQMFKPETPQFAVAALSDGTVSEG